MSTLLAEENDGLRPCPFCGMQPELNTASNAPSWYIVQCKNIYCEVIPEVQREGRQEVVAAWNRRAL